MAEVCVVNASPLIFLSRGGHLPLLRIVAARALVPHAVAEDPEPAEPTTSRPVSCMRTHGWQSWSHHSHRR